MGKRINPTTGKWEDCDEPQQQTDDKSGPLPEINIEDPAALEALAMVELVAIVQTAPRSIAKIPAIKELLDRIKGKAPQSIAMTVKRDPVSQLTASDLSLLLAQCKEPVIIPPMPEPLLIDN